VLPAAAAVMLILGLTVGGPVPTAAVQPGPDPPVVHNASVQTGDARSEHPRIVAVYPNPAASGDDGEFVTLRVPPGTVLEEYALADDHAAVDLSAFPGKANASTVSDASLGTHRRITLSTDPALTASLTGREVLELPDAIRLANDGERIRLLHRGAVVDAVSYDRSPEAEVYDRTEGVWRPLGATDLPVVTAEDAEVELFALPDEPDRAVEFLRTADRRILLAGYTFASQRVTDALLAAHERGVTVRVLVDGSPVGGMPARSATLLEDLDRGGVDVTVIGGDRARYTHHHAKYAVVDGRALVTTENWKPAGTGGRGSRGWAVITGQDAIVSGLVDTFRADTGWADAVPWSEFEPAVADAEPAGEGFPSEFAAETAHVDRTRLLVAPDNAEDELLDVVDGAERSVDVKQVHVGDRELPFLQAVLDAAGRGVRVRILLSSQWYVEEENRELAAWLNEQARADDLPLEARLAQPGDRYEKIHAKGLVVDGETVVVGSINWNNNSLRDNREVALILEGEEAGEYFEDVFEADWGVDRRQLPAGLGAVVALGAVAALVVATRLQFER